MELLLFDDTPGGMGFPAVHADIHTHTKTNKKCICISVSLLKSGFCLAAGQAYKEVMERLRAEGRGGDPAAFVLNKCLSRLELPSFSRMNQPIPQ